MRRLQIPKSKRASLTSADHRLRVRPPNSEESWRRKPRSGAKWSSFLVPNRIDARSTGPVYTPSHTKLCRHSHKVSTGLRFNARIRGGRQAADWELAAHVVHSPGR